MVTHHLLDSLPFIADLHGTRSRMSAPAPASRVCRSRVVNPQRRFTLIDSNGKKIRFVSHAARELGLTNVEPLHARVSSRSTARPSTPCVARAFAPLPALLESVGAAVRAGRRACWP